RRGEGEDLALNVSPMSACAGRFLFLLSVVILFAPVLSPPVSGQQPFITDDADVTPRRHFHFEFSNQFDLLQRSSFPNLRQNTADFELDYGLFHGVEIGIESPWLIIINDRTGGLRTARGIGDTNLSLKYNFLCEKEYSRWPAMSIALNYELPTGDTKRQLGSGLADF